MLEPITIITAVVGIVAASTKLIPILATLANFQDAPKHAQDILLQVAGIQSIAKQLQAFIERRVDAPQVRQYLINVEHIQVILVECVITYSELEPIMDSLGITPARGFWNRIKWKYKENDISRILDRLHDHRLSLSLMLTILNGHSLLDAEASRTELCNMVSQVLDNNKELLMRLRHLDKISAAGQQAGPSNIDPQAFSAGIEEDLSHSRVYQNIYSHLQLPTLVSQPYNAFSINTAISMCDVPDVCSISLPLLPKAISNAHWYTKDLPSVYDTEPVQMLDQSSRTKENDNMSNAEGDHTALRSTSQANDPSTSEVNTTQSPHGRRTCSYDAASGGSGNQRSFDYCHSTRGPPLIHFSGLNSLENIQASANGRSYIIPKNGVPITIELYASEPLPRISRKVAQNIQSQIAMASIGNVRLETPRHRHSVPAQITTSSNHEDRATSCLESSSGLDKATGPRLTRHSSPRRRPRAINSSTETVEVPRSRYNNPGYRANDRIPRSGPSSLPPSLTIPISEAARLRPNKPHSPERQVDKKHTHHQSEDHRPRLRRRSRISENELTQRHDQSTWESSDTDNDYTTRRSARQRNHSRGRRQFETPPPPYRESIYRNRLTKRPPLVTTESSSSIHPHSYEARNYTFSSYDQESCPPSRRNNKPPVSRIWDPEQRWQQDSDTEQRRGRDESRGRGVLRGLVERGKSLRSRSRLVLP